MTSNPRGEVRLLPGPLRQGSRLRSSRCSLSHQPVRLSESGLVPHGREKLVRLAQRFDRLRLAQRRQAPALAEQGIRALRLVPELAPAIGRLGVEEGGLVVFAHGFGELSASCDEGVLCL